MKLVLIVTCLFIIPFIITWFITYTTLKTKYKYYKPTYLAIKNKQYLLSGNDNSFITFKPKDKVPTGKWQYDDDEIIYFKEEQSIKLKTNVYIHRDTMPFIDPYTEYWYRKIKKEILYNSRSIAQIREDKLKLLLK